MKYIILNDNEKVKVDDSDYEYLSSFSWCFMKNKWSGGYVTRKDNRKTVYMHRMIMNAKKGEQVDHINHDGLDNRRSNLRIVTQHQNNGNLRKSSHNTSGYKGVSFYKRVKEKPWSAYITNNRKKQHLGYFKTIQEAAIAYNQAAIKQWGNFALLNEIV